MAKATTTQETVLIPAIDIRYATLTVVGDTPLIMHKWSEKAKKEITMENYIYINGSKINLTDQQAEQIKASFHINSTKLADIAVGDTFKIGDHEFIVLEHSKETTAVIRKEILKTMSFGRNNNYDGSTVDAACNAFAEEIAAEVGAENLVMHTVDLTSDDGLKDYGKVRRKVSLLTPNLYRRYVEILDKHPLEKWWWLVTAFSTKKHNETDWVKCVSPSGFVNFSSCNGIDNGVRPFCILKSTIFVSK